MYTIYVFNNPVFTANNFREYTEKLEELNKSSWKASITFNANIKL